MISQETHELVEAVALLYPGAVDLARIVSLAVRIEPEFIRKVRLIFLPQVDAGSEADLWFSPLIESQSSLSLTFVPEVAELLRTQLAEDQQLLNDVWEVLREFHRDASPALRLEEEVTWLALLREDNIGQISQRLDSVIAALVNESRPGLAQWAYRALPTMPPRARDSEAARILTLVASAQETVSQLDLRSAAPGDTINEKLARIISNTLPKISVGVRLIGEAASTGAPNASDLPPETYSQDSQKTFVEFSYPPNLTSDGATSIDVPETNPVLLEVSWTDSSDRSAETRVSLVKDETKRVEVGSTELSIRTALGKVHSLKPHYDFDFFLYHNLENIEWAVSLANRLRTESYENRALKVMTVNPNATAVGSDNAIRTSRIVGLVASPQSLQEEWINIKKSAVRRFDFRKPYQWLVVINPGSSEMPPAELEPVTRIDFGPSVSFDVGYQRLLSAIRRDKFIPLQIDTSPPPKAGPVPESLLSMQLDDAKLTEFFTFFHLAEAGRDYAANGETIVSFKPAAESFRAFVEVRVTLSAEERIIQIQLWLARAFINDRRNSRFASDISRSMLRATLPSKDRSVIENLISETRDENSEVSSPAPVTGVSTYLGFEPRYTTALGDSLLVMENINQNGEDWLGIEVAVKPPADANPPTANPPVSETAPVVSGLNTINLFISYAEGDEIFRDRLLKLVTQLEEEGLVTTFGYAPLTKTREHDKETVEQLQQADIVLLVLSPAYLAFDLWKSEAMERAMGRSNSRQARLIPIMARPVDWSMTPFHALQVLPDTAKAITLWRSRDEAYESILKGIRSAAQDLRPARSSDVTWAIDVMQSLALAFHVRKLEPRLSDELELKKFYEIRSDLDFGDFTHVRKESEYVFHGPVTAYLHGDDPFQDKGDKQVRQLRELIDKTRSDPSQGLWLSHKLQEILAKADAGDRQKLEKILGKNLVQQLDRSKKFSTQGLMPILDRLSSAEFWAIATKYMSGFYQLFNATPTTLSRSADFPTYILNLMELLERFVGTAAKNQSDRSIEVGFAIPFLASARFGREFPDITFNVEQGIKGDEPGGAGVEVLWSISLTNFARAVTALKPVILTAVRRAASHMPLKNVTPATGTSPTPSPVGIKRAAKRKSPANRPRPSTPKSVTKRQADQKPIKNQPFKKTASSSRPKQSRKSKVTRLKRKLK